MSGSTTTGGLALGLIAESQTQKFQTHNDALQAVDLALTAALAVPVAAGNAALTAAQYRSAVFIQAQGAGTAGRTVTLPAVARLVLASVDAASTAGVAFKVGTASVTVQPGSALLLYTDGSASGLVPAGAAASSIGFAQLTDSPGSYAAAGGDVVRVKADGSGLEYHALALADVAGAAPLASPTFTGTPTAPTAADGDHSTLLATTAFVHQTVADVVGAAPAALDTLKELADALGDDANYAATMTTALAAKAPLASPALSGTPTTPTPAGSDNSLTLPNTSWVRAYVASVGPGTLAGDTDVSLTSPSDGDRLRYSSTAGKWVNGREPYVVAGFISGAMTASQILLAHKFGAKVTFPANFGGTNSGESSGASALTLPTAQTVLIVSQCTAGTDPSVSGNWSQVGTITFAAGGHAGTFASTGGAVTTFQQGDKVRLTAPATADATLANVALTLAGDR